MTIQFEAHDILDIDIVTHLASLPVLYPYGYNDVHGVWKIKSTSTSTSIDEFRVISSKLMLMKGDLDVMVENGPNVEIEYLPGIKM